VENELILVLFGHIRQGQSVSMLPFWRGFIELQRNAPSARRVARIVAHNWSPELSDLVRLVYSPHAERYDQPSCSCQCFSSLITSGDLSHIDLTATHTEWTSELVEPVLQSAYSLARAVQLIDVPPALEQQVLVARWDLDSSDDRVQFNSPVFDEGLPREYIYLSYSSEVEKGYEDAWMIAPLKTVRSFGNFDTFALESLLGRNAYLEQLCESGWPRSCIRTRSDVIKSHPVLKRAHNYALRLIGATLKWAQGTHITGRLLRRITRPVLSLLQPSPQLTAENSFVPKELDVMRIFPLASALNTRALFKYFILSEGLRERTRFLTHEDFEIASEVGQLINPQPIVLLLWNEGEEDGALHCSKDPFGLPIIATFNVTLGSNKFSSNARSGPDSPTLQLTSEGVVDRLLDVLEIIGEEFGEYCPILILPSVATYHSCTDWYYLNALVKYIVWKKVDYICLDGRIEGEQSMDFPGLKMVRGDTTPSFNMVAGTARGLSLFLNFATPELRAISQSSCRALPDFPLIALSEALFE
jgi:hypothetical protein